MCLYSKTRECQVAEEPITVYKYVAKKYNILDGKHKGGRMRIDALRGIVMWEKPLKTKPVFVSPYYPSANVAYLVGETIKDNGFQATATEKYCHVLERVEFTVDRGLHTSKYQKDADMRAKHFVTIDYETAVLRCTIPAGARYFEGDSPRQYCSDRIKILGWRYRNEEPGKWHFKGGNAMQTKRSFMNTLRNLFRNNKEE